MSAAKGEYHTKGGEVVNASKVVKIKQIKEDGTFSKLSIIATNAPESKNLSGLLDLAFTSTKINGIVVLGKADKAKIVDYWSPEATKDSNLYGDNNPYKVISEEEGSGDGYNKYKLKIVRKETGKEKELPLWNYYEWPDHQLPTNPDHFEKFVMLFNGARKLLVHCSAGVGRTGVFSGCVQAFREGKTANPKEIVESMREARTMMVQTPDQFDLMCKFILRNCYKYKIKWDENINRNQLSEILKMPLEELNNLLDKKLNINK